MSKINLAVAFLKERNESICDYEGFCGELVDGIIHFLGEDRVDIMYLAETSEAGIQGPAEPWKYHMVPVIDGEVHDAWFPEIVALPTEYLRLAFPKQEIQVSFYGKDK